MRRTALFLGGFLLASGASLALAGPAQAADSYCKKSCGSSSGYAVVHSAPRPTILVDDDDCDDVLVYSNGYRNNRVLVAGGGGYYGGGLSSGYGGYVRSDIDVDGDGNVFGNGNQTFTVGDIDLGLISGY